MDTNLRYGQGYTTVREETYFRFDEAGGFQEAVEMCSGVGQCRKKLVGTMCPSYMATLEEQHSTRGRANALRAALSGRLPGGLESDELYEAMDLCLECKACKSECPSSVDMAKLKYEFLAHYHARHGYPLRSHLFARIDWLNRSMAPVAGLANLLLHGRASRWLMERIFGIDRRRRMPPLASPHPSPGGSGVVPEPGPQAVGTVVFYNDTFTEYNEPGVGRAAVALLESAGFEVVLPHRPICCGRPLISKGFIEEARDRAGDNLRALAEYSGRAWPIVAVEPSCASTYQDDYLDLAVDADTARRVAGNFHLLDEFLAERMGDGGAGIEFTDLSRRVLLHGHCHQKALSGTASTLKLLAAPPGYQCGGDPIRLLRDGWQLRVRA